MNIAWNIPKSTKTLDNTLQYMDSLNFNLWNCSIIHCNSSKLFLNFLNLNFHNGYMWYPVSSFWLHSVFLFVSLFFVAAFFCLFVCFFFFQRGCHKLVQCFMFQTFLWGLEETWDILHGWFCKLFYMHVVFQSSRT